MSRPHHLCSHVCRTDTITLALHTHLHTHHQAHFSHLHIRNICLSIYISIDWHSYALLDTIFDFHS